MNHMLMNDRVFAAVQELGPLAEEAGISTATLALAWVLQNDNVSAAIIGATRPEQVEENVKASGVVLEQSLMKRIDEILADVIITDPSLTG
jgi:aryl-alcohol dehydrogenase-like predicted oxidoreductase